MFNTINNFILGQIELWVNSAVHKQPQNQYNYKGGQNYQSLMEHTYGKTTSLVKPQNNVFMSNNNYDYNKVVNPFNLRLNHQYLVASKTISNQPETDLCGCGTTFCGQIFLQRIPLRLSNVNQIPFPDILHVYYQAFKGFQILVSFVGYFIVEQDMICINSQDIVKIWLNADLSKYYPDSMQLNTQAQMVNNIINIIQRNTQKTGLPMNIKQFLIQKKVQTFSQAILAVEEFSKIYNARIPIKLDCVTQMRLRKQGSVIQKVNSIKVNAMHIPPKIPAIINNNAYKMARLNNVRSTQIMRPSRVINNVQINRISQARQNSLNRSIIKKNPTTMIVNRQSRINHLSPIKRANVLISPSPLQTSNIKEITRQIIKQPMINFNNKTKVEGRDTSQNIFEAIRSSRQISDNTSKPKIMKTEYKKSQIQSQPKQKEIFTFTKGLYQTPQIQFEKFKDISTMNTNVTETRQSLSRKEEQKKFETPRKVEQIIQVSRKDTQSNYGNAGTTSFEFFGFVGLGNSNINKSRQVSKQKVFIKSQKIQQQTNKIDQYLSNNTSHIQSRIQVPSNHVNVSTPIKQYALLQTTYQSSTSPYQNSHSTYQQKIKTYGTSSQPYQTFANSTSQFTFKPATTSFIPSYSINNYQKEYSSKNYMDIYNISSSLYPNTLNNYSNDYLTSNDNYLTSNSYGIDKYNDYGLNSYKNYDSGFNANSNYGIDSSNNYYNGIDNYKSSDKYGYDVLKTYDYGTDSTYKKYDYQIDTKNYDYNHNSSNKYDFTLNHDINSYDLNSYKPININTYIVPTYDNSSYKISNYDDIKTSNLKQTRFTTNTSNLQYDTKLSNQYETNFSRHLQQRQISTAGYSIENLASIYIPIQGYKVTIDNELLADLQKLRAKGLMQQAILNEQSRIRSQDIRLV